MNIPTECTQHTILMNFTVVTNSNCLFRCPSGRQKFTITLQQNIIAKPYLSPVNKAYRPGYPQIPTRTEKTTAVKRAKQSSVLIHDPHRFKSPQVLGRSTPLHFIINLTLGLTEANLESNLFSPSSR